MASISANDTYFSDRSSSFAVREQEQGLITYPHKFNTDITVAEFKNRFSHLSNGERDEAMRVAFAGRVISWREQSSKLIFFELRNDGDEIQILLTKKEFEGDFDDIRTHINRGDIVGVSGFPCRTKRGELSLIPRSMQLLSPCLRMLPGTKSGLVDQEIRYRKRYLDGILNHQKMREILVTRSAIIKFIREFFDHRGFLEVETPILGMIGSGATALTFDSTCNATNLHVVMRISPELALKQLVVAGFEKVYELGRQFRNEGLDMTHNPEFTSIETYEAYVDYHDLMSMTEELLSSLVLKIKGSYKFMALPFSGEHTTPVELDFSPPFRRISMIEELERILEVKFPRPFDSIQCHDFLIQLCKNRHITVTPPATMSRLLDTLVGTLIEPQCMNPTFIINHPQVMSPLAKYDRDDSELTERFELFIVGKEFCNAYTELNNPHIQRKCFASQLQDREAGDNEAQKIDHTFIDALDHGLPPTGGFGLGIDRLCMLITGQPNIKEVLTFPMMRVLNA